MIYISFRTSARRGGLFSYADICAVKRKGRSLGEFLQIWKRTVQGLAVPIPDEQKQELLHDQLEGCQELSIDLQMYDRAQTDGDHEKCSYKWLLASAEAIVERARERQRRQEQLAGVNRPVSGAGGGGGKALATPAGAQATQPQSRRAKAAARKAEAAAAAAEVKPQTAASKQGDKVKAPKAPALPAHQRSDAQNRGFCIAFQTGSCKNGKAYKWEHSLAGSTIASFADTVSASSRSTSVLAS